MKSNDSRQRIIEAAKDLFWRFGIQKVTVESICGQADVSKMTFYRKFPNKTELAKTMLTELAEEALCQYKKIMNDDLDFAGKIAKLVRLKHDESLSISEAFLKDIYQDRESELWRLMVQLQERSYGALIRDLSKAQEKGEIRPEIKHEFILEMLSMINDKMRDEHFLSLYSSPKEAIMELTNFFMYGLFPPNRNP